MRKANNNSKRDIVLALVDKYIYSLSEPDEINTELVSLRNIDTFAGNPEIIAAVRSGAVAIEVARMDFPNLPNI